jgi:predicted kinase
MSRVIIFCGLSGTGKTTLARAVSRELNIVCIGKDDLKENMYDLYQGDSLKESNFHGQQSAFLLNALAEKNIQNGVDIILESPFNHPDNPKLFQEWVSKFGAQLKIIVCSIAEDERLKRVTTRERHASHHDKQRIAEGQFQKEVCDYSLMPEEKLFLETSLPEGELLEQVVNFLKK